MENLPLVVDKYEIFVGEHNVFVEKLYEKYYCWKIALILEISSRWLWSTATNPSTFSTP